MGALLGLNTSTIMKVELEESIDAAESAGFDVVELRIPIVQRYLESHTLDDLARIFAGRRIRPISLNAVEKFNRDDDAEFSLILDQVRDASRIADAIDCPYIILVPRPEPGSWQEVMPRTRERVLQICEAMRLYHARPLVEFIGFPQFPLRTIEQACHLVESVEGFHVGVVFDTFHHAIGHPANNAWKQLDLSRISIVHLDDLAKGAGTDAATDEDRAMPGMGDGNLPQLVADLHAGGFRGSYSVELFDPVLWDRNAHEVAKLAYECAARTVQHGV